MIETHSPHLNEAETKQLVSLHYDEERFVRFALVELKAAKRALKTFMKHLNKKI